HVAYDLALSVVEHVVNLGERRGGGAPEALGGVVEALLGGVEGRRVEALPAERPRDVAARFTHRSAQVARRVLELVERAQNDLLLARRRVEPRQDRVQKSTSISPAGRAPAGVPVAPRGIRRSIAVSGVMTKSAVVAPAYEDPHEADEAECSN